MSLINQMLQDLEQRSVGSPVVSGLHGHIRAVPERRRIHPAWWLVLVLSLALISAAVWYWTRPAPVPMANPNLSLKIAPDLATLPSPVAQSPLPPESAPAAAPVAGPVVAPAAVASAPATPVTESVAAPPVKQAMQAPVTRETPAPAEPKAPARDVVKDVAKGAPPAPVDDGKPLNLAKQIKPLTPQQQSENEYNKANLLIHAGRNVEAMPGLELALKLDARNVAARQALVGLLLQAKRNDEAARLAQEGLTLDPAQSGLSMILARVQLEQGDVHAALGTMERGLATAGPRADYHAFMAALLMREKRNKEAIEQYTIALTSSPQTGVWWMGLGMALQDDNHAPEAREAYQRAKASNSLTPELQAYVEQKLGQLPKS